MNRQLFCEFESHEIYKEEEDFLYLYKPDEKSRKSGLDEMVIIEALSQELPLLDTHSKNTN